MIGEPIIAFPAQSSRPGFTAMHRRGIPVSRAHAVLLAAVAAVGLPKLSAADEPPAIAVFADGAEIRGPVTDLADPAKAAIAKQPLLAAGNPVRWVHLGKQESVVPDAFIEFDNGDRLPGRVILHEPEGIEWETIPAAACPMNHPTSRPALLAVAGNGDASAGTTRVGKYRTVADDAVILVRRDRVRRVVWRQGAARRWQPRTLFLANGGVVAFRSLRWTDEGVIALLNDGTMERHDFGAISELHLPPRPDPWAAWFESLVDESGVIQAESRAGIRLTTPRSRWRPAPGTPVAMIMTQPSWSLRPVFLPVSAVSEIAVFGIAEAPLSWIAPAEVTQRSPFGASWTWQADRNVQGGPLDVAGPPAGWGFGVQARTELVFPLCDGVQAFRGRIGLDRAAGSGGCVRASLHVDDAGTAALWASDLLVGSGTWADCGSVALAGPAAGQKSLVLVADDAHRDRPAGADPFDIRDVVDWCDPLLILDPVRVAEQVAGRLPFIVPAWTGWAATPAAGGTVKILPVIDPIIVSERAGWAGATVAEGGPLRLTREWSALRPEDTHLLIAVSAVGTTTGGIELYVDGMRWEIPLPARANGTGLSPSERAGKLPAVPFVFPLAGRPEGPLAVEIVAPAGLAVQWHALGLTGDLDGGWFPLEPVTMESSAGSTFKTRDDGAILVSLPVPELDDYTIRLRSRSGDVHAVRIDALTDPSLKPSGGPGRSPNGRARMSGIVLSRAAAGAAMPLQVVAAYVDRFVHPDYGPEAAVARTGGLDRFWEVTGVTSSTAVFQLQQDDEQAADEIEILMEFRPQTRERNQESLGCFRVYGSSDPHARLPITNVTWLVQQPEPDAGPGRKTIVGTPAEPGSAP